MVGEAEAWIVELENGINVAGLEMRCQGCLTIEDELLQFLLRGHDGGLEKRRVW